MGSRDFSDNEGVSIGNLQVAADGAWTAARWGARAAVASPRFAVDQIRALVEPFDLRGPDRRSTRSRVRLAAEAMADEALMTAFRLNLVEQPPHIVEEIAAEVDEAIQVFGAKGWLDDPTSYFEAPPRLVDPVMDIERVGRLEIERLSFPSDYAPHPDEPGGLRWESYEHNHTAHAWVLRHWDVERPWLVLHHGASMGWSLADLTIFRAAWLHHDLQLNLVFPVMPFHGPRARRTPLSLQLPVEDPVDTVHAIAQSVWDSRRLIGWIREQSDQPIAIHGLSLGTYPASLVASLEPGLASLTAGVPAASLSDLYVHHLPTRLRRQPQLIRFIDESKALLRVVSPLAHDPLVPRELRFIYAASGDRVTDPIAQAQRLWKHWDQPEILWFDGGHIGVAWSCDIAHFLQKSMMTAGLLVDES